MPSSHGIDGEANESVSATGAEAASLRTARVAFIALLVGALCIAFAPIFVRLSELAPTATAFHRMLLALPLFGLWALVEKPGDAAAGLRHWPRRQRTWLVLSGLFFAADLACWHWSIAYTSVANATLLANGAPVFVTIAAWLLFGERITLRFLFAMALALSGAALLVRVSFDFGGTHPLGDVLGIVTAMFYAAYIISIKALRRTMSTAVLMSYSGAISALALCGLAVVAGESLWPATLRGWSILFLLAWVSQGAGQGLIAYGLAHLPASFSSVSLLLQPAAAAALAWMILGEALSGWQALGGAAVLLGVWLARRATRAGRA